MDLQTPTDLESEVGEQLRKVDKALGRLGLFASGEKQTLREACQKALDKIDLAQRPDLAAQVLERMMRLGMPEPSIRIRWARVLLTRGWKAEDLPSIACLELFRRDPSSLLDLSASDRIRLQGALEEIRAGETPFARAAAALLGSSASKTAERARTL